MEPNRESWDQWGQHVRSELIRLNETLFRQEEMLVEVRTIIAGLQVKAGIWGAIAGAIPALVAVIFILIREGR